MELCTDLVFELTRWCNMECWHCLRGDRQRSRIKKEYIVNMLKQIKWVDTLSFTGGEPSLAIDLMEFTYSCLLQFNIRIDNFYITTNGSTVSKRFFNILEKFYTYASDGELNGLRVSADSYHKELSDYNRYLFERFSENLSCNSGCRLEFRGANENINYLLAEGKLEGWSVNVPTPAISLDADQVHGYLYVNTRGNIVSSCDLSYESQKDPKWIVGHCNEDLNKSLRRYFNDHKNLIYT